MMHQDERAGGGGGREAGTRRYGRVQHDAATAWRREVRLWSVEVD